MALIPCPECKTEVSDKAGACPRCGNPMNPRAQGIAVETKGRQVVTTQQTAKPYKLAQAVGVVLAIAGAASCTVGGDPKIGLASGFVSVLGFVIFITARIGAWWRHG